MLGVLYVVVWQIQGKWVALLTLLAVASDTWIIFTNQGIYIEDSQLIFLLLSLLLYWKAQHTLDGKRRTARPWLAFTLAMSQIFMWGRDFALLTGVRQTTCVNGTRSLRLFTRACPLPVSKLGETSTTFEVKLTKSARRVEIRHPEPGETAPHLEYQHRML
ncbi:hypothetical protein [Ktedonobacter robiniae]|uniref:Glycosyltransferase RgtA/B/C/D-like domain-containing protein n=1 Tax=Ktedonobacter robiniae TaxID=2778365 RepID=A0ABQ3V1M3_9CHLR|nr:hypothetical protein [Ktedonobacter robiniae]GHO58482.1 hypothetical protein KSB_69570 [Ktedonobacter robiniae]